MSEQSAATEGMKRGGYYDDHSEYQRATAASGDRFISQCVAVTPLPGNDETFVIADYGSSYSATLSATGSRTGR